MIQVEVLNSNHDRNNFDCGVEALNDYLRKTARQHDEKGISKTFVLIEDVNPMHIIGFVTLLLCEIKTQELPNPYPKKYPSTLPAAKLGRLAISKNRQNQGLGTFLMLNAMERIIAVSKNVGIIGLFVDAKNNSAKSYYESFGFIPLIHNPFSLFLPMQKLIESFSKKIPQKRREELIY